MMNEQQQYALKQLRDVLTRIEEWFDESNRQPLHGDAQLFEEDLPITDYISQALLNANRAFGPRK